MSGGAGHQVVYDGDNGKFSGYGSPEGITFNGSEQASCIFG